MEVARETGIPFLPWVNWGSNVSIFFESKPDLLEATVAYFRAGLDQNELCVWAISDPVTELDAKTALYSGIHELDQHLEAGNLSVISAEQWRLKKDEFNLQRITAEWSAKLLKAVDRGYSGLRISGNAAWLESHRRKEFCAYDQEFDRSAAGRNIILLCTRVQSNVKAEADYFAATQAHHFTIACRDGEWTFVDVSAVKNSDDSALSNTLDQFSASLKKHHISLTHREKAVLAFIVRGVSSKRAGQLLGISPRTIEFHRSNIMEKINVRNVAELVRTVLRSRELDDQIEPAKLSAASRENL